LPRRTNAAGDGLQHLGFFDLCTGIDAAVLYNTLHTFAYREEIDAQPLSRALFNENVLFVGPDLCNLKDQATLDAILNHPLSTTLTNATSSVFLRREHFDRDKKLFIHLRSHSMALSPYLVRERVESSPPSRRVTSDHAWYREPVGRRVDDGSDTAHGPVPQQLEPPVESSRESEAVPCRVVPTASDEADVRLLMVSALVGVRCCRRTRAGPLYLFCTCTRAFCRFSPIEPIEFSKSFENSTIVADRLPPPPNPFSSST
jgi:hypothetical protein